MQLQDTLQIKEAKTVLISGGSRGIGAAAARAFWEKGYRVAIFYHQNAQAALAVSEQCAGEILAVQCDVSDATACAKAFAQVQQVFGIVDVLVCNAGVAQQALFTDITAADWAQMIGVNLNGAFYLSQLALPGMIAQKQGCILTVSSMWGQVGASCEVHYSAAKAGVIGLTKALAKEEGPSGITVNCICPGVIDTDMMASFSAEEKQMLVEEIPLNRLGTPGDVAALLCFLASDDARYITGQVFGINGGMVI